MSREYTYGANPAFARPADALDDGASGLTKREYFAALALQGLLANASNLEDFETWHEAGEAAVEAADGLIAALNKGGGAA